MRSMCFMVAMSTLEMLDIMDTTHLLVSHTETLGKRFRLYAQSLEARLVFHPFLGKEFGSAQRKDCHHYRLHSLCVSNNTQAV